MVLIKSFIVKITKFIATIGSMQNGLHIARRSDDPFIISPHLSPVSSDDGTLKALNRNLPVSVQHYVRDKGIMRFLADNSALLAAATLGASKPSILYKFTEAGKCMKSFKYGDLKGQNCQVFNFPAAVDPSVKPSVLILVHGGAWGSGKPWMYRLMAVGMAKCINAQSAIVVQYPLFPERVISEQSASIYEALRFIRWNEQELGLPAGASYVLSGHSSGANICALALLTCVEKKERLVDSFIALCGVYNIEKHYHFEKARGAHEFSPMSVAAIGPDRWWESSPTLLIPKVPRNLIQSFWPDTFLLHGMCDTTVPYSSSQEFAEQLLHQGVPVNTCYPETLGHADCIFEFTNDGPTATGKLIAKYYDSFLKVKQKLTTTSMNPNDFSDGKEKSGSGSPEILHETFLKSKL
jgi:acetyl esterase/lipase